MADTISVSIIITFAAELLFSLALPILVLVIWKKKEGTELRPAWIGAAAYFVFGMVLEQLINAAVLGTGSSAVSAFLLGHPWLYAVYGGLSVGILEETARFLVYRTMLKDSVGRENAVTFGIGFGGLECIMVLGLTVLSTLMMSISFNSMGAEAFAAQYANSEYQIVLETIAEINAISPLAGVMNCVERAAVFALQIELSVLMFGAVRSQKFCTPSASCCTRLLASSQRCIRRTCLPPSIFWRCCSLCTPWRSSSSRVRSTVSCPRKNRASLTISAE